MTDVATGLASGAMLDPAANEWQPTADAPLIDTGFLHPAWTGRELIVWDGNARYAEHAGAIYLPDSNSCRLINKEGSPSYRDGAQTLWTGKNMLLLGGKLKDSKGYNREIFSYDPAANLWSRLANAPEHTLGRNFGWSWGMREGQHLLFWEMDAPPGRTPIRLIGEVWIARAWPIPEP